VNNNEKEMGRVSTTSRKIIYRNHFLVLSWANWSRTTYLKKDYKFKAIFLFTFGLDFIFLVSTLHRFPVSRSFIRSFYD